MRDAVIVSTARTGLAKAFRGALNNTHGATMGGHVAQHAMSRAKLDPKEVEDVLSGHPAIADASVYAIASEFFGEDVAAALRVRPGTTVDTDEVQAFCRERIARFKVPRFFRVVDAFPLTASGKIQKFRLREDHEALLRG